MSLRDFVHAHPLPIARLARRFRAARRGNIAMMTALLMMPMMGLMGLAVDYGNALFVKSRLDQAAQAAAVAAANAARNVVQSANRADPAFDQAAIDSSALAEGRQIGANIFNAQLGVVINGSAAAPSVVVTRVSNTFSAKVTYSATLNTYFARLFNFNTFNLNGARSILIGMVDAPNTASMIRNTVVDEKWVTPGTVQSGDPNTPVINDWYSGTPGSAIPLSPPGGSLLNGAPVTPPSAYIQVGGVLNGVPMAPIISKKVYLLSGNYEFRYWYKSTVVYPDYEPVYICGSVEGEMHWVTATATRTLESSRGSSTTNGGGAQTSRVGAYLVPILTNPQLATTPPAAGRMKQDGTLTLPNNFPQPPALPWSSTNRRPDNSQNRIDICTYSSRWIQRSVPLSITSPGYFWLSFVAEPPTKTTTTTSAGSTTIVNAVNGFYLGRVQLCEVQCSEPLNNNWPWAYGTNLYTADFTSGTPGLTFNSSGSGTFGANALYEKTTNWTVRVFGGLAGNPIDSQPLFVYQQNDKSVGPNTIVASRRLSTYLYRGLLLTAGTYRATFTIGSSSSGGPNNYCGSAIDNLQSVPSCGCFVGSIDPNIAHGDQIAVTGLTSALDRSTSSTVAGYYSRAYVGPLAAGAGDDTGVADTTNSQGYILGNCWPSANPKTFTYCFLVPRTQFYGVNFRTSGPQIDTSPVALASSVYPELRATPPDLSLGTGGARVYSLTVDVLSQGIQNNNNLDFATFYSDCNKSIAGNTTPGLGNVMTSGTPVWPGVIVDTSAYSTPPVRLTLKAPLQ